MSAWTRVMTAPEASSVQVKEAEKEAGLEGRMGFSPHPFNSPAPVATRRKELLLLLFQSRYNYSSSQSKAPTSLRYWGN